MALVIKKQLSIIGGIQTSLLYVRLFIVMNFNGRKITVNTQTYVSKSAYNENGPNVILVNGIPESISFDYDRAVDGTDLLLVSHQKLKEYLSTDQYMIGPLTDEKGGFIFDASGELQTEQVISALKFAEKDEISITL